MAQNTQAAYGRDLKRFFEWNQRSSRTSVHEIGVATVTGYLEYLQGLGLAASSCGRNLVAIRMFFRYLMLEGIIAESSVDLVSSPKLWERLPKVLSPEMVDSLLISPVVRADRFPLRDRAMLAVLYATGCRVSEVVHLKLGDIAFEDNFCRCTGKGNKQRLVSLNPLTIAAIRGYLESERPGQASVRGEDEGWLFLSRSGRRMNREMIWALVEERDALRAAQQQTLQEVSHLRTALGELRRGASTQ